ncbi:hypothetical protein MRB53_005944 [Persea americana]|uniref:Uncharacterized protein n=1 Tax=Persea americana TaxID=3435 RepID=A0ACC2MFL8_PERAE|nr:hypothetical protein MRB53_005944 [Persea americana]
MTKRKLTDQTCIVESITDDIESIIGVEESIVVVTSGFPQGREWSSVASWGFSQRTQSRVVESIVCIVESIIGIEVSIVASSSSFPQGREWSSVASWRGFRMRFERKFQKQKWVAFSP